MEREELREKFEAILSRECGDPTVSEDHLVGLLLDAAGYKAEVQKPKGHYVAMGFDGEIPEIRDENGYPVVYQWSQEGDQLVAGPIKPALPEIGTEEWDEYVELVKQVIRTDRVRASTTWTIIADDVLRAVVKELRGEDE